MVLVPNTSLIAINPEGGREETVLLIDLDSGAILNRLDMGGRKLHDGMGTWWLFADPHGCWIGAYGTRWVQLFGIKD